MAPTESDSAQPSGLAQNECPSGAGDPVLAGTGNTSMRCEIEAIRNELKGIKEKIDAMLYTLKVMEDKAAAAEESIRRRVEGMSQQDVEDREVARRMIREALKKLRLIGLCVVPVAEAADTPSTRQIMNMLHEIENSFDGQ